MYWESCKKNNPVCRFEIYEFSSNSWRVVIAPNCVGIYIKYCGVTLKGNTYWISVDEELEHYLLSFDFTRERFRRLCLPPAMNGGYYMALSVVKEEQLSVLTNSIGSSEMEMWVTEKIDTETELSWSKSFVVDLHSTHGDRLRSFTSLLIDEEKKVALCCDLYYGNVVFTIGEEDKYYTQIPYTKKPWLLDWHPNYGGPWWPIVFSYVPSFVQIQPQNVLSSSQAVPIVSETATKLYGLEKS